MHTGEDVVIAKLDGTMHKTKITKLFSFCRLKRTDITETVLGDIIAVAGVEGITIGETITDALNPAPLPPYRHRRANDRDDVHGEQLAVRRTRRHPTLRRAICGSGWRKELLTNVSLRVEDMDTTDSFKVLGRGELQLSITIEMMRREGYELMVGKPEIVTKRIDGEADGTSGKSHRGRAGRLRGRGDGAVGDRVRAKSRICTITATDECASSSAYPAAA